MSKLHNEATHTIDSIRKRAEMKRGAPDALVTIEAISRPGKPFQWHVAIGWYEGDLFNCEVASDEDIHVAVEKCLDKLKPVTAPTPWTPESARARVGGTVGT